MDLGTLVCCQKIIVRGTKSRIFFLFFILCIVGSYKMFFLVDFTFLAKKRHQFSRKFLSNFTEMAIERFFREIFYFITNSECFFVPNSFEWCSTSSISKILYVCSINVKINEKSGSVPPLKKNSFHQGEDLRRRLERRETSLRVSSIFHVIQGNTT